MGCKRSQYRLYGKQIEYFCPIWLEKISNNIEFYISVYSSKSGSSIYTNKLLIDSSSIFGKYLFNYINYVGLNNGCDDILAITLHKNTARVSGLNVSNGRLNDINISYIIPDLLLRERPLMEFDNIIIDTFRNNNLISKQLFNFNLCFNLEDIVPRSILKDLEGRGFMIDIKVLVDGEELERKDFYSNFEYIPKTKCGPVMIVGEHSEEKTLDRNVLDYLQDYKCIDLMDKNKITQNIIHWSLYDNNDYIFNIYNGFSGFSGDTTHNHLYSNAPDLSNKSYNKSFNNTGWCNLISINYEGTYDELLNKVKKESSNILIYSTKHSTQFGQNWIKNIYYPEIGKNNPINVLLVHNNLTLLDGDKKYKVTDVVTDEDVKGKLEKLKVKNWPVPVRSKQIGTNNSLNIYIINSTNVILVADDLTDLTFASVSSLKNTGEPQDIFDELVNIMKGVDVSNNPPVITPIYTLDLEYAKSPSLSTSEIEYYKSNNGGMYVLRYSGKLKPTFISPEDELFNYAYVKIIYNPKEKNDEYIDLSSSGFFPLYPSVNYYAFKHFKINYKHNQFIQNYEYKWYEDNSILYLIPTFETQFKSECVDGKYKSIQSFVRDYLKNYYNIDNDQLLDYICSLYEIKSSFEYALYSDITQYVYNVKIKLL